jgi:hypothetical protein
MGGRRPRRRRLSLSLRAMLLAIVASAIWLGWWVNSSHNQQAAVTAVETSPYCANVFYEDDPDYFPQDVPVGRWLGLKLKTWVPSSLRARLGRHFFYNALAIAFSKLDATGAGDREVFRKLALIRSLDQFNPNIEVVDADVAQIAHLPNLKRLSLRARSPRLTDASLQTLAGIPCLEALEIFDAPITDAGVAHLRGMRGLKSLLLGDAGAISAAGNMIAITGDGFSQLAALPALTELEIHSAALRGDGLKHVGSLRHLKRLKLEGGPVTDDDLRHLAPLIDLESLEIERSSIDGTGFGHLAGLSRLNFVCLEGPNITGAAVTHLARLPALESIMIYGTHLTASELAGFRDAPRLRQMGLIPAVTGDTMRLKHALPNCNVLNGGRAL